DLPFAIGATAHTRHLERYLQGVEGVHGALQGDVLATGTVTNWRDMEGNIYLSSLSVGKGDYTARNDGVAELAFRGSALEVRQFSLRGPTGTRLSLTGLKDADGSLDLQVDGGFDVRLVESFTHWIEQSAGRVMLSATITGTMDRMTVVGSGELENGKLQVHGWPVSARNLNGRFEFSQNKIFVNDITGAVNNGRAALRGVVELKQFKPHRLDLGLLMDDVQARIPETLPSTVAGEVRLVGALDHLLLTGEVDVLKARYTRDVEFEKMLLEIRRRRLDARSFEKQEEWLRYDVELNVIGDARIDNNLVKTALGGKLRLVGTNARLGLQGSLSAQDGGRAFFRGNELSLTRAVIDFTEKDRIAAVIDVHAETQVREYKVNIHAFGPWDDPQVEPSSEPALAKADVVTLLTLGFTSRDQGDTAQAAGVSLVGETLFNMSGLDKQVKKFIPKNAILRDFTFQISTQYSEANMRAEPTAQFESKFLTDALKLRLSQPVVSGRGRRAQAEYRFNERVSAQAQWDDQVMGYSFGDLGLDLKLRWELN
ncbi:MAG: translocation/assembly module TamB domain-containing protein, partial [Myxococcales bacterium]